MEDRSRVLTAACAGAVIGGIWGWVYLTDSGRRVRERIEPTIDRLTDELKRARVNGQKAKTAVEEGRQLVTDVAASIREFASAD